MRNRQSGLWRRHAHSVPSVPGIFCLFCIVLRTVKGQEERARGKKVIQSRLLPPLPVFSSRVPFFVFFFSSLSAVALLHGKASFSKFSALGNAGNFLCRPWSTTKRVYFKGGQFSVPTMPTKTCLVLKAGNFLCRPFYRAKAESERGKKVSKDSSKASFSSSSLAEFSNAFSMSSFFPFLRSYFSFLRFVLLP